MIQSWHRPWFVRRNVFAVALLLWVASGASASWFADAVWYQVFPERFRNGDTSNDPTVASLEGTWPYFVPNGWQIVPWTSDWYQMQPWEKAAGRGFYVHAQLRRYGGDLEGIIDELDYIKALGVNTLYLNPVFESASLHKYGATMFHHVDKHFGPDPAGDLKLFAAEDAADVATWRWSAADRLFLRLIEEVHRRDMRIIIDGVFNHVGIPFWAFQRARKEGPDSRFAKWFHITRWDDPDTPADEFDYQGWVGIKDLPEFRKDERGPHPEVKEHFRAVLRRWMDPDGDGDPSDGIDGWRLDVAAEVPIAFWKEFRGWVKAINPEAYLTGEIWWDDYGKCTFKNAQPWLDGAFDSVMNYRFGDAVYQFFNQPEPITATAFATLLADAHLDHGYERSLDLQNLFGSHDTSRIGSAVVNPKHRQDHGANLQGNRDYQVRKPSATEKRRWKQMVAFQFLAPGAPYIYYGDEVGMWGADDPDCRKPMVWDDLSYETERAHPFGLARPVDSVEPDTDMLAFYRIVTKWRREHVALRRGTFRVLLADDRQRLIAFQREHEGTRAVAVFNASDRPCEVRAMQLGLGELDSWRFIAGQAGPTGTIAIGGRRFVLLIRE
jgi:cyclomaltodextrinase / maltogenic alpha-amylase / neopullulanase